MFPSAGQLTPPCEMMDFESTTKGEHLTMHSSPSASSTASSVVDDDGDSDMLLEQILSENTSFTSSYHYSFEDGTESYSLRGGGVRTTKETVLQSIERENKNLPATALKTEVIGDLEDEEDESDEEDSGSEDGFNERTPGGRNFTSTDNIWKYYQSIPSVVIEWEQNEDAFQADAHWSDAQRMLQKLIYLRGHYPVMPSWWKHSLKMYAFGDVYEKVFAPVQESHQVALHAYGTEFRGMSPSFCP